MTYPFGFLSFRMQTPLHFTLDVPSISSGQIMFVFLFQLFFNYWSTQTSLPMSFLTSTASLTDTFRSSYVDLFQSSDGDDRCRCFPLSSDRMWRFKPDGRYTCRWRGKGFPTYIDIGKQTGPRSAPECAQLQIVFPFP